MIIDYKTLNLKENSITMLLIEIPRISTHATPMRTTTLKYNNFSIELAGKSAIEKTQCIAISETLKDLQEGRIKYFYFTSILFKASVIRCRMIY